MLRFQGWVLLSQCNQVVTLEFIVLLADMLLVVHDVGHGLINRTPGMGANMRPFSDELH